jgi:hypothetical protein
MRVGVVRVMRVVNVVLVASVASLLSASVLAVVAQPAAADAPAIGAGSDIYAAGSTGLTFIPQGSNAPSVVYSNDELDQSNGAVVDSEGNFYSQLCSTVTKYSPTGVLLGPVISGLPGCVLNMALDNEGDMFIDETIADPVTDEPVTVDLIEVLVTGGAPIQIASWPLNDGSFSLAVDPHDNVYQYDGNDRILIEYAAGTLAPTTVITNLDATGVAVDSSGNIWITDYILNNTSPSIVEYPADGGPAIDLGSNWQTSYGTFDPSLRNIGYAVAIDSSDDVFIGASLLTTDLSFVPSGGIWEKAAGSSTFVQITQSDPTIVQETNGEDWFTIAVPHGGPMNVLLTVTTDPVSQSALSGQTLTFTAAANGVPAPAVQWQYSIDGSTWATLPGATSTTYTTSALSPLVNGWKVRALFTNASGSAATNPATITVTSPSKPVVTTNPQSQAGLSGQTLTFTAAASGTPSPTVQWQYSIDGSTWGTLTGATAATYTTGPLSGLVNGWKVRAVFTNTAGSAATNPATLTVTSPSKPVVTTNPQSQAGLSGQTLTFTAAANGIPAPAVQWQYSIDGSTWNTLTGATSTTYTTSALSPLVNGWKVRALFTNASGSAATNSATITVH